MYLNCATVLSFLLLSGCSTDSKEDDTGGFGTESFVAESAETPTISGTFRILDALSAGGIADVSVTSSFGETSMTDANGGATVAVVENGTFSVTASKEGALDHLLYGPTGQNDFEFITFMATDSLVGTVTSMLNTSPAEGTGLLVVGIDYDNLSPAVGATASVNANHDNPWVIGGMGPAFGDTIPMGGMGMVAFPGLLPGESVAVDVTPPEGTECTAFPSGGSMPDAPIVANTVTVITYHCR